MCNNPLLILFWHNSWMFLFFFFFFHGYQESPTGELVDYSFSATADSNEQESESDEKNPQLDPESDVDVQAFHGPDEAQEKNREDGKFSENVKVQTS